MLTTKIETTNNKNIFSTGISERLNTLVHIKITATILHLIVMNVDFFLLPFNIVLHLKKRVGP